MSIFIQTSQAVYHSGDTIQGMVGLVAPYAIENAVITLSLRGYEKAKWQEKFTEMKQVPGEYTEVNGVRQPVIRPEVRYETRAADKDFFNETITLCTAPTLMPGSWTFPFTYKLHDSLPGVFEENGEVGGCSYKGRIVYKLVAKADIKGPDLKAKQRVVIHERLPNVQPVAVTKAGKVMFCCCINKGDITMTATFDANSYMPGQTANIHASVKNASTSKVDHFVCILMRQLTMVDKNGHRFNKRDEIWRNTYEGCPPMEERDRPVPLNLPAHIKPASKSNLIDCHYWVQVECDIPWAPDLEIHLPVKIFAPVPATWGTPGFNPSAFQPYSA